MVEEPAAREELDKWRTRMLKNKSKTPIFEAIKSSQHAFNGYGAQETCDMLAVYAILWPGMPVSLVCKEVKLWRQLLEATFAYQRDHIRALEEGHFPSVSGSRPFRAYADAHERFLAGIPCCRRRFVHVSIDVLNMYNSLSLLKPHQVIGRNGKAEGKIHQWVTLHYIC